MMFINPALRELLKGAEQHDSYWVEKAKLAFAVELHNSCRAAGITNAQLAKKLGTSAAYITKVFRGDTNFTIETMVKLARAANASLDVKLVDTAAKSLTAPTQTASVIITGDAKTQLTVSSAQNDSLEFVMRGIRIGRQPHQFIDASGLMGHLKHA